MKPLGLRTAIARRLTPPARPPIQLVCLSQSSVHRLDDHREPSSNPAAGGSKFVQLAQDLQQQSLELIKLENIQIDHDPSSSSPTTQKSTSASENLGNEDSSKPKRSRKKLRKVFEEDPEFKFDRKRGKRHIMAALKQSKLNPNNSNLSEKIQRLAELDLGMRSGGRLEKLLLTLPRPPVEAKPTPTTSSLDSFQDQPSKPVDEFVNICLGPLVWSNPEVDISLTYNKDQVRPKLTFWMKDESSTEGEITTKEVEITESMSRSEILHLILNFQKN